MEELREMREDESAREQEIASKIERKGHDTLNSSTFTTDEARETGRRAGDPINQRHDQMADLAGEQRAITDSGMISAAPRPEATMGEGDYIPPESKAWGEDGISPDEDRAVQHLDTSGYIH